MSVESKAVSALTGSTKLMALLAAGKDSVYHDQSKDAGTYPVIVYTMINDSPHQHVDNVCNAHFSSLRVWIETNNGAVNELSELVYKAMIDAGFMWQQNNDGTEDNYFYRAMDFTYAELL